MDGICTLANDRVYDQVVALINSIEANDGSRPVCIFPYDDRVERLRQLAAERPQVMLYDDQDSIRRWDALVERLWATHPTARQRWDAVGSPGIHRMGTHRRFCAFDGPFDRFLYMDADTLLLRPVDFIFDQLDTVDWVTYDFQFKDLSHVFEVESPRLATLFSPEQLARQSFCSGFYGTHRGLFDPDQMDDLLAALAEGEAEVLYPMAPDQTVLNYFVMRRGLRTSNLAQTLPPDQRTGNSVTSAHFQVQSGQVFDHGKPLTYLHYIGIGSGVFRQLCAGENLDFPYRDVFLHYRYQHDPESRPALVGRPRPYQAPSDWRRWLSPLTKLLKSGVTG